MRRGVSILRDHWQHLSIRELLALLWNALFKNETVLIYCMSLQTSKGAGQEVNNPGPVVKGELIDLERARKRMEQVPWEFKCDLYDGVKDFFIFKDTESGFIGHISWLYYSKDPNRTLRLGIKECEVMFCLTPPEYRGKGLYPSALQAIQRYLKGHGYEKCFICVDDDNLPSIRGIEKSGFHRVGRARLLKMFGFQTSRRRDTRYLKKACIS